MSYQGESGPLELRAWREPLETSAALYLGQLLFGFSRLDLTIQRYLDAARRAHTPNESRLPLRRLLAFVDGLPDPALRSAFRQWMARVHRLEGLRAALASGQWIPDSRSDRILHDPGPEAVRVEYRLHDLDAAVRVVRQLQDQLRVLCATERGLGRIAAEAFLKTQPVEALV